MPLAERLLHGKHLFITFSGCEMYVKRIVVTCQMWFTESDFVIRQLLRKQLLFVIVNRLFICLSFLLVVIFKIIYPKVNSGRSIIPSGIFFYYTIFVIVG